MASSTFDPRPNLSPSPSPEIVELDAAGGQVVDVPSNHPTMILVHLATPKPQHPSSPLRPTDSALLSPPSAKLPRRSFTTPYLNSNYARSECGELTDISSDDLPSRPSSAPPSTDSFPHRSRSRSPSPQPVRVAFTPGGELLPPPPSLGRPTTFWRNTRRSAVSGPSFSPSSHLIRRSTFVAAGLDLSRPVADISALAVDTRSRTQRVVLPPETTLPVGI